MSVQRLDIIRNGTDKRSQYSNRLSMQHKHAAEASFYSASLPTGAVSNNIYASTRPILLLVE